jgi:hypothetical protein
MLKFGTRNVIKQGGSKMISLPMIWVRSVNPDMETVIIEMNSENKLIIVAGDTLQDTTGSNNIHGDEYQ